MTRRNAISLLCTRTIPWLTVAATVLAGGCEKKDTGNGTQTPTPEAADAPAADATAQAPSPAAGAEEGEGEALVDCSQNVGNNGDINIRPVSDTLVAIGKGSGRDISAGGSWCCNASSNQTINFKPSHTVGTTTYNAQYFELESDGSCSETPLGRTVAVESGHNFSFCFCVDDGCDEKKLIAPKLGDPVVQILANTCGHK